MSTKAFPFNVEVRHVLIYKGDKPPDNRVTGAMTVEMNHLIDLVQKIDVAALKGVESLIKGK